jgi:hypothetical protein
MTYGQPRKHTYRRYGEKVPSPSNCPYVPYPVSFHPISSIFLRQKDAKHALLTTNDWKVKKAKDAVYTGQRKAQNRVRGQKLTYPEVQNGQNVLWFPPRRLVEDGTAWLSW